MLDTSIYVSDRPPIPFVSGTVEDIRKRPGVYVTRSLDPGYAAIQAMIANGEAKLLAERTMLHGLREIVAEAPIARRLNPDFRLGPRVFTRSPSEYRNWRETWWREVIQNSVDAGARTVHLSAKENEDKSWTVSCEDDGKGMTPEIIEDVFFVMGETTKLGEPTARGGFGRARELIIMPWPSWTIASGEVEYYTTGLRPGHSERRPIPRLNGTRITATMPADLYTDDVMARDYLSKCYLPEVRFILNGHIVKADNEYGDLSKEWTGLASVYFKKSHTKTPRLHVRLGGMHMFDKALDSGVKGHVYIEVLGRGTEVLTANRDDFNTTHSRGLALYFNVNALVQELTIEKERAVKKKTGIVDEEFRGEGLFQATWNENQRLSHLTMNIGAVPEAKPDGGVELPEEALERIAKALKEQQDSDAKNVDKLFPENQERAYQLLEISAASGASFAAMLSSMMLRGPNHLNTAAKLASWRRDFYIHGDIADWFIPKRFRPGSMPPTIFRLAKVWAEICLWVMAQLGCEKPFGVGWHFTESASASYYRAGEKDWLLLNPFRDIQKREEVLRPTNLDDLKYLYALAVHETTHMASDASSHDVDFAYALTRNHALTADGFRHLRKVVSAIKLRSTEPTEKAKTIEDGIQVTDLKTRKKMTLSPDQEVIVWSRYRSIKPKEAVVSYLEHNVASISYRAQDVSYGDRVQINKLSEIAFPLFLMPVGGGKISADTKLHMFQREDIVERVSIYDYVTREHRLLPSDERVLINLPSNLRRDLPVQIEFHGFDKTNILHGLSGSSVMGVDSATHQMQHDVLLVTGKRMGPPAVVEAHPVRIERLTDASYSYEPVILWDVTDQDERMAATNDAALVMHYSSIEPDHTKQAIIVSQGHTGVQTVRFMGVDGNLHETGVFTTTVENAVDTHGSDGFYLHTGYDDGTRPVLNWVQKR